MSFAEGKINFWVQLFVTGRLQYSFESQIKGTVLQIYCIKTYNKSYV